MSPLLTTRQLEVWLPRIVTTEKFNSIIEADEGIQGRLKEKRLPAYFSEECHQKETFSLCTPKDPSVFITEFNSSTYTASILIPAISERRYMIKAYTSDKLILFPVIVYNGHDMRNVSISIHQFHICDLGEADMTMIHVWGSPESMEEERMKNFEKWGMVNDEPRLIYDEVDRSKKWR